MDQGSVNQLIITIVQACIVPILGILTTYAVAWIKSKISSIQNQDARDYFNSAVSELELVVNQAVSQVSQTYVDSLKRDGKFDLEEQQAALEKATELAIDILRQDTCEYLCKELTEDGFNKMLNSLIEQVVRNQPKAIEKKSSSTTSKKKING